MLAVRLQSEGLKELQRKAAAIGRTNEVGLVGGRAVANLVKDHLFALDSRANRLGGVRTHFYSNAAKSVSNPQAAGGEVSFNINQVGLAQRWLGGTITAGVGTSSATGSLTKYLAIPARAEAYGRTPGEWGDLQFVPRGPGKAMLVQALQTQVRGTKTGFAKTREVGGLVMYWLVDQVTQKADPSVMPTEEEMVGAAEKSMGSYLSRRLKS